MEAEKPPFALEHWLRSLRFTTRGMRAISPRPTHRMHVPDSRFPLARDPAVSIIMPIFNAGHFLPEAIASIEAQNTSQEWELLLVDDGSTDDSLSLAQQYAARMPDRVRLFQHPGGDNRGTSAARNLALRYVRAPVTGFLDADDVWLPGMLRAQLALLDQYPHAALVYANAERTWDMSLPFDPAQGPLGPNQLPPLLPAYARPGLLAPPSICKWFLLDETMVPCTCTVLVRTAIARAVGGFVEAFEDLYDDQAFYAKILLRYPVAVSQECVARYRWHDASCCAQVWHDKERQAAARTRFHRWLAGYQSTRRTLPGDLDTSEALATSRTLDISELLIM